MKITLNGISKEEANIYIERIKNKYPGVKFKSFEVTADGEYADIRYEIEGKPFDRIRRITGYLVGTLDRFNDGKRAEEKDRVKHG